MPSASLAGEVAAALRVQEAARSRGLPSEMSSTLMFTFHLVWREALVESGARNVDDRQRLCAMAADAVITLAKAGLEPEQIRSFARSNLRFMATSRQAAAIM